MIPRRIILALSVCALLLSVAARFALAEESGVKVAGSETAKAQAEQVKTAKPKAKKKAAVKKKAKTPESRYKSRALTENSEHSYRFNAKGEPVGGKKNTQKKAVKSTAVPPEEKAEDLPGACSIDAPCPEKGSDADAL